MIPFIKLPLISLNLRQAESTWRENFLCRDAWKIINCPVLVIYWVFEGLKLPFSKEQNSKEISCCNEVKYGNVKDLQQRQVFFIQCLPMKLWISGNLL